MVDAWDHKEPWDGTVGAPADNGDAAQEVGSSRCSRQASGKALSDILLIQICDKARGVVSKCLCCTLC